MRSKKRDLGHPGGKKNNGSFQTVEALACRVILNQDAH